MSAIYSDPISDFLLADANAIVGVLTTGLAEAGFDTTHLTAISWQQELADLQSVLTGVVAHLPFAGAWHVLLEYIVPIVRTRLDCVLLAGNLIFVVEYKGGVTSSAAGALAQAQSYALNLTDYHEESRGHRVIPLALGSFSTKTSTYAEGLPVGGAAVGAAAAAQALVATYQRAPTHAPVIDVDVWDRSRYFPVPSIIESASAVYSNHDVRELAHSRAGSANLESTQNAIEEAVSDARARGAKVLLVVTGVPGAGKTLAGLNAVQRLQATLNLREEQASFLSGNGPLVKVLQEALKRSAVRRSRGLARAVESRVREVHRFVRDTYADTRPPADTLIVFDEAQRAWTASKNEAKFGRNVSEPAMVLEIMARHPGWAVVVALVGGGQEIHGGEAGLSAWGDAICEAHQWEVVTSPEAVRGGAALAGSRLFRPGSRPARWPLEDPRLHLGVSRRSFESETSAAWVNAVLEGDDPGARALSAAGLPVSITRSLACAREWLTDGVRRGRRAGLVASSGALRLRAEGVEPPTFKFLGGIDVPKWFLEPAGDHRSSNMLEVALSEFELQGLELDLVGLLWGGDLVARGAALVPRRLSGNKWTALTAAGDPQPTADDPRTRVLNKYRVLLTRYRKAMVIYVPRGCAADPTRLPADLDATYAYLLNCGLQELPGATD